MKRLAIACTASMLAIAPISASAADTKGFGTAVCSELTEAWNGADVETREVMTIAIGQWIFGYLSGRNGERQQAQRKELGAMDNDETAHFIVEQCATYPSMRVYQIADIIFDASPPFGVGV